MMEPDPKEKNDEEDSSTKQVLEYYQKYSQSKQLPKYFSGTSISYLPQIVDDERAPTKRDIIHPIRDVKVNPPLQYEKPEQNLEVVSPTESLASNRKLEWDNLGDIGYNNAKRLHKSASLPILTQDTVVRTEDIPKSTTDNVKIVIYPYTSSSEEKSSEKNTLQSSSSSSPVIEKDLPSSSGTTSFQCSEKQKLLSSDSDSSVNNRKILEFKEGLSYIKRKIGLPDAHSTPCESEPSQIKCQILSETPCIRKSDKPIKNIMKDINTDNKGLQSNVLIKTTNVDAPSNPSKKSVNLCLTKPVLLDCLPQSSKKQSAIGIQTETADQCTSPPESKELDTFYKQSEANKASSDSGKSSSSNGVASKCDSFEYVKSNNNEQNIPMRSEDNPDANAEVPITDKSKEHSENSEAAGNNQEDEPSKSGYDIEKDIYVLQRLIRSKKYDSSVKRKYIRRILQKITESKYLEDSSASSDLFYPKTDPSRILHDHIKNSSLKNDNTSSSYQSHEEKKVSPKKKLSETTDSDISHEREQKLEVKPSTSTFGYRKENKMGQKKKPDSVQITNVIKKPSIQFEVPVCKERKRTPFTLTRESNSPDKSSSPQQNWKECKTASEKILESDGQTMGAGDHVTQFADKEREYQLNWIDREINHLGKLKSILEKYKQPCPLPENLRKMTSVYMVTANNNDAVHRNYVIETKVGAGTSQQRNFRINGENYVVEDPNVHRSSKGPPPVVADIQVFSTDKTTNIKVTAFCSLCKRSPCVCVTDFLQGISNPFKVSSNIVKKHLKNDKTKTYPSSCSCITASTSTTSSKSSSHTICIDCHRTPCTCCSCRNSHDIKTCSVCQLYTCMCVISPKDSFTGTFIPAKQSSDTSDGAPRKICALCKLPSCICKEKVDDKTKPTKCCRCNAHSCICKNTYNAIQRSECKCLSTPCTCSSSSLKSDKTVCSQCGRSSCSCKLPAGSPTSSDRSVKIDSLLKLFSDCKCGASNLCSCEFVDKLLRHFNKNGFEPQSKAPVTNVHSDIGTQNQVSVGDKITQNVVSEVNKSIQPEFTNTDIISQTDSARLQSQAVATENPNNRNELIQAGIQDKITGTIQHAAVTTERRGSVDKATASTSSRKSSTEDAVNKHMGIQSQVQSVEQATYSMDGTETVNKYVGKTTEEYGTQSYESISTVDKEISAKGDTYSRKKSVSSATDAFQVERGNSNLRINPELADKNIASEVSQALKATNTGVLPDTQALKATNTGILPEDQALKATNTDIRPETQALKATNTGILPEDQVLKATNTDIWKTADSSTYHRPSLVDQETNDIPRVISVEHGTSPHSSARASVDRGTYHSSAVNKELQSAPIHMVDRTISSKYSEDDKASGQSRKTSKDQFTSPIFSEEDKGISANVRKETASAGGSKKTSRSSGSKENGTSDMIESTDKKSKIPSSEKATVTSSKAKSGPSLKHRGSDAISRDQMLTKEVTSKKHRENDIESAKKSVKSIDIQTELLSKDIRSIDNLECYCSSHSSLEKHRKRCCLCCGDHRKRKPIPLLICAPLSNSHKSRNVSKRHRRCESVCRESVCYRARSRSISKMICCSCHCKKYKCCDCQNKKGNHTGTSTFTTPQKTPVLTDGSPTDSVYTNSSTNSTCCCCGNKVPLEQISILRSNSQQFSVCEVCLKKRPILTTICFAGPDGDNTTESSTQSITVTDHFKRAGSYCTCKKSVKSKNFQYCSHCKQQLKKTQKSRNGIAYTLTLEDESPEKFKSRSKKKTKKLEEIKVKVPNPYNRKQHKNIENTYRKDEDKMKKLESGEDSENEENVYTTNSVNYLKDEPSKTSNKEKDNDQCYTLQEYLQKNRPHFVDAAEYRRLALINNKIERELNKDEQKLRILEENANNNLLKRRKLFTEQEMREITKRNYKKLPEVQQKLTDQRIQKLRSADRFMADMLNRKIQNCVLKGKRSFPIDTNVVNVL